MTASTSYQARILDSADALGKEQWNALAGTDHPFTRYEFIHALENSGSATAETGWQPCHIIIEDHHQNPKALMPAYLKSHSYGEYVFDHNWAHAYEQAGGRYYPKLQISIPFTPATGPRFLTKDEEAAPLLIEAAKTLCLNNGFSSLHCTFLNEKDCRIAKNAGLAIRHDEQFHWTNDGYQNFDDFLDALASRKRKAIRKERKTALENDITVQILNGQDITEAHWDAFFTFYQDTGARKWGTPYLTRSFFSQIGQNMGEQIVLILAYREGRPIAGALNFKGKTTLYGRYWGAIEHHPFLHFELCYYQAIDYAIRHGLSRVEAGAQGAHKVARGYAPVATRSAHWMANESFHDAVREFVSAERDEVDFQIKHLTRHTPFKKNP
ncbi:MAG: GNAT family N-acetyltransferase [Sphingomonadales bacterium]|jgi:predicted N-acyltransferase